MFGLSADSSPAPLDGAILLLLGDASIKICVAFAIAAAAAFLLRRSSAAMRHVVWAGALLAFVLTPVLSATMPKWRVLPGWHGLDSISARPPRLSFNSPPSTPQTSAGRSSLSREQEAAQAESSAAPEKVLPISAPASPSTPASASTWPSLARAAFAAWLLGFGFMILRTALSRFLLGGLSRSSEEVRPGPIGDAIDDARLGLGISRRVDVRLSDRRGTPMTWGLLRVRLLLPAEASTWDGSRLRAVLLHEFAHVRRLDTVTHVLAQLVQALYWFHPLVWTAARRFRAECEHACDDMVLACGVKASDYAENLPGILVPQSPPCSALALKGRSELESRLRAILSEGVDRRSVTRRGLALAAMIAGLSTAFLASLQAADRPTQDAAAPVAASTPPPPTPPSSEKVIATCVDSDGKPVSEAEVHLFQYTGTVENGRFVHSGPFVSDEHGKAVCSEATTYDDGNHDRWFYTRVRGRLVGVARSIKWTNHKPHNAENRILLTPSQEVEGQVTVPQGYDPTKVTVLVRVLHVTTGSGPMDYESFPREHHFPGLDTSLPEIFESHPGADGRIRFGDVPTRGLLYLVSRASGLGEAQWSNSRDRERRFREPIQMPIDEESMLSGRVLSPDGKPAVGMKVTARLSWSEERQVAYLSSFHAVTNDAGDFAIHGLPQIKFTLSVEDPKKTWTFRPMQDVFVPPHQDPALTLRMEAGVRVRGTVKDPDGRPVKGAAMSAVTDDQGGAEISHLSTNADGRFEFRLPAGTAHLYFNSLPDGFAYPEPQIIKHLDIDPAAGDVEGLEFTLQRQTK